MAYRQPTLLMLLLLALLEANAQGTTVTGRVVDKQSGDALEKATLQLYRIATGNKTKKDTTFVGGTLSGERGVFAFRAVKAGTYWLKATFVGYMTHARSITVDGKGPLSVGSLPMESDSKVIDETVVTANIPKMVIKDDTVVYNADAFRVKERSSKPWSRHCPVPKSTTTAK